MVLCLGLGVAGGFAGGYYIGLPLTVLIPILPVRAARYQGLGPPALVSYAVGVLLAVCWLMLHGLWVDTPPDWPPLGVILVSIILVILSVMMFYAALRKPYVRNRLPNSSPRPQPTP
jgi:TRAP-type C4-dicarboxylate transport system permease small subunit